MAFSFGLREAGTNVRTEMLAGLTTWLAMVYIVAVNPGILATTGMDHGAVFVATCLGAGIASIAMGLYANYPLALAPGMGLNAYFAFAVVGGMKVPWQVALGAVFLSGVLFLASSLLPGAGMAGQQHPAVAQARHRRRHRPVPRPDRPGEHGRRGGQPGHPGHARPCRQRQRRCWPARASW